MYIQLERLVVFLSMAKNFFKSALICFFDLILIDGS